MNTLIIGAGISGLSCASTLQSLGHQVLVVEKSRGVAGRMSTRRAEEWQCDHGAQYFTARDPAFATEVERWIQARVAALWSPQLTVLGDPHNHQPEAGLLRYVGYPRMTSPARFLAESIPVQSNTTVTGLIPSKSGTGWHICTLESGLQEALFDQIILAVPAPQAKPLLAGHHPLFTDIAAQTTMRGSWSMMLQFNQPLELVFDAAFVNTGPLRWVSRDSSKPGRNGKEIWLLHANAVWSEAHIEAKTDVVAEVLIQAFIDIGGNRPDAWTIHRWRYADTLAPLMVGSLWDASARIGVCGDWLQGGKVEGAWLSGRDLARKISKQPL